jgi:hypothetical protein
MTAFNLTQLIGAIRIEKTVAPLPGATWLTAGEVGDGVACALPAGALASARWLTADLLLDGIESAVFKLSLHESGGRAFRLRFGLLNQCQARVRFPLDALNQNRWMLLREGAWLKPICDGDVVDPAKVDRLSLVVIRKGLAPVRWCMTSWQAIADEPQRLTAPLLPKGKLVDEFGQSTLRDWPGKTRSESELVTRLRDQLRDAPQQRWPEGFSRWGGDAGRKLTDGSGFFATHHDGRRWWLIDPDGHPFWSAGQDCVRADAAANIEGIESALPALPHADAVTHRGHTGATHANYLVANLIRAFGPEQWHAHWSAIALAELRRAGFNTVANWSEWKIASAARFPYVRPIEFAPTHTKTIFRDFPDVFDPAFERDAEEYAQQLVETRDDPALIGYFLMNEPTWGFARQTPAEGMLINTTDCHTRRAFEQWKQQRGVQTPQPADLEAFSAVMVERFFRTLTEACRKVDPHHLNLGARYYTIPPAWCLPAMASFDVFSFNCYRQVVPSEQIANVAKALNSPVLVGEWHFGALDVGLPASGIGHVRTQGDRGRAYRRFLEMAAADPNCIGVHHFILYDQHCLGRFDGENYNIGFLDVCHRPYEPLVAAARASHERLYRLAAGEITPTADVPEYLPLLFY